MTLCPSFSKNHVIEEDPFFFLDYTRFDVEIGWPFQNARNCFKTYTFLKSKFGEQQNNFSFHFN